jgi:uncharacterized SAM-binding protein YcdF (DUF218 family)
LVAWLLIAGLVLGVWWSRAAVLTHVGAALVSEDPPEAVDVVVVSNACTRTCVLEAAAAWHEERGGRFVVARWVPTPGDAEIRALGVALPDAADIARDVLEKTGVPPERIEVLEDGVDGTNREIAAVARWAAGARPATLLFMTARTHTARAAWLLRRSMPPGTRVLVRSPGADRFGAADWWHDRNQTRDVAFEYLRWLNTFLLGDAWSTASGSP